MKQEELQVIIENHKKWLMSEDGGCRANLRDANLCGTDLCGADLRGANLCGADLCGADLCGADLRDANLCGTDLCGADLYRAHLRGADLRDADLRGAYLRGANLRDANLCGTDLCGANLCGANLCGANLRGANLRGADLRDANLRGANLCGADLCGVISNERTAMFGLACPEEGEFIGWKKANGLIVKLLIPADAKRSSATTRKCRCSKARVLSIQTIDGDEAEQQFVASDYDKSFFYRVGETVEAADFDEDRWNECSTGIHFFITRREAEQW